MRTDRTKGGGKSCTWKKRPAFLGGDSWVETACGFEIRMDVLLQLPTLQPSNCSSTAR